MKDKQRTLGAPTQKVEMVDFACEKCGAVRNAPARTPEGYVVTAILAPPCRICGGHLRRKQEMKSEP